MEEKLEVEIKINGNPVELNRFVQRVTANVILGIVRALRIPGEEPETVELKLLRRR